MLGVKQILVDGSEVDLGRKKLSLQDMQRLVSTGTRDPLIEFVHMIRPSYVVGQQVMVVHESGLNEGLRLNKTATQMVREVGIHSPIVGDVFIGEWEESDF